ncbi:serine acetyltransferase [Jeongeupia naejangsanensis]|uniref:Serine acetyltransferase n=1 Tax=Jeongeupia naejangsanensis TaxID=613195 RepID=A0ABS2BIQ5_9NEIS|nr:serine acetyltransferase [Jeongeupia naejangsanensis]MBM3115484.1 serine acetyltransferase [Jeongeupia naejangsanensis]
MKWDQLRADTHRQYGEFSWGHVIKGAISRRTYRVVVTLRLCQAAASSRGPLRLMLLPLKVLHRAATQLAATDLSWQTMIGGGIALTHGWGLVVNQGAVIGRNVTLFHGVTLGRRDRIASDGSRLTEYPVIEDEVWIGPHAIIVGGVTIGRGSRIAGGAFVTESVPPYSVVVGNPASVVKANCIPDVSNPAPL